MPLEIEDWIGLFSEALEHYKERLEKVKQSKEILELGLAEDELVDVKREQEDVDRLIKNLRTHQLHNLSEGTDSVQRGLLKTALTQYQEDLETVKKTYASKLPKANPNFKKLDQKITRLKEALQDDTRR